MSEFGCFHRCLDRQYETAGLRTFTSLQTAVPQICQQRKCKRKRERSLTMSHGINYLKQTLGLGMVLISVWGSNLGAIAQTQSKPIWLDREKPANWNKPGASLPKPLTDVESGDFQQCKEMVRPATAPEDKLLSSAGWKLFGSYQRFGKVSLVRGFSGIDGMCRPMGYQDFVFVNGKFAGTLSPQLMDSRSDGASGGIYLFGETEITTEFARYKETDALCCPSAESSVSYQIQQQKGQPVVVPTNASTSPTSP